MFKVLTVTVVVAVLISLVDAAVQVTVSITLVVASVVDTIFISLVLITIGITVIVAFVLCKQSKFFVYQQVKLKCLCCCSIHLFRLNIHVDWSIYLLFPLSFPLSSPVFWLPLALPLESPLFSLPLSPPLLSPWFLFPLELPLSFPVEQDTLGYTVTAKRCSY